MILAWGTSYDCCLRSLGQYGSHLKFWNVILLFITILIFWLDAFRESESIRKQATKMIVGTKNPCIFLELNISEFLIQRSLMGFDINLDPLFELNGISISSLNRGDFEQKTFNPVTIKVGWKWWFEWIFFLKVITIQPIWCCLISVSGIGAIDVVLVA